MITKPESSYWEKLVTVPMPHWIRVRQRFDSPAGINIAESVRNEFAKPKIRDFLRPGLSVAVGVGSRGIASLTTLVKETIDALKAADCAPFIVPAMGSHGNATAAGQVALLADYGVTEKEMGVPIRATMEAELIGQLSTGLPLYFDKHALDADLVVPICRIKPHTGFRGGIESGITKMLGIGFGKHIGAQAMHQRGFKMMAAHLLEAQELLLRNTPFGFGIAAVENAYKQTSLVEAIPALALATREPQLLQLARSWMARLPMEHLDVLVVYEIGKNISGVGMDPNITGRYFNDVESDMQVQRIVVLNLTPATHGNAQGIGMADVTTERVVRQIDLNAMWVNATTSGALPNSRIPIFMPHDRAAIQLAIKTCGQADFGQAQVAWIHNTAELGVFYAAEALWATLAGNPTLSQDGAPTPIPFNPDGSLTWKEH